MTKKIFNTPQHKERAQPKDRLRKYGLLEKHKDYKQRADHFSAAKKRLRLLKEKARLRTQDEFYHSMISSKTRDGVHIVDRQKANLEQGLEMDGDTISLMKSQDLKYVQTVLDINRKRISQLKDELGFVGLNDDLDGLADESDTDQDDNDEDAQNDDRQGQKTVPKHLHFVESRDELSQSNLDKKNTDHSDNDESDSSDMETCDTPLHQISTTSAAITARLQKEKVKETRKKLRELAARLKRQRSLKKAEAKLQLEKNMRGKGRCYKVGESKSTGVPIYKWRQERAK